MISMDSANGHLASNYNVPVITLWGSTHPCLGFTPFGQPKENSIVSNRDRFPFIPTSVYGNKKVKGYEDVMRTIDPKLVIDLAYKILKGGGVGCARAGGVWSLQGRGAGPCTTQKHCSPASAPNGLC